MQVNMASLRSRSKYSKPSNQNLDSLPPPYSSSSEDEDEQERILSERYGEAVETSTPSNEKKKRNLPENETEQDLEKDFAKDAMAKRPRNLKPKFEAQNLIGPNGLIKIKNEFPTILQRSTGKLTQKQKHSKTNLKFKYEAEAQFGQTLLSTYTNLFHELYPHLALEDLLLRIEKFGSKKEVKDYIRAMRDDTRRFHIEKLYGMEKADRMLRDLEDFRQMETNVFASEEELYREDYVDGRQQRNESSRNEAVRNDTDMDEGETEAVFEDEENIKKDSDPREKDMDAELVNDDKSVKEAEEQILDESMASKPDTDPTSSDNENDKNQPIQSKGKDETPEKSIIDTNSPSPQSNADTTKIQNDPTTEKKKDQLLETSTDELEEENLVIESSQITTNEDKKDRTNSSVHENKTSSESNMEEDKDNQPVTESKEEVMEESEKIVVDSSQIQIDDEYNDSEPLNDTTHPTNQEDEAEVKGNTLAETNQIQCNSSIEELVLDMSQDVVQKTEGDGETLTQDHGKELPKNDVQLSMDY